VVTHQLQVERRTAKAHRPKTDALLLDHATNHDKYRGLPKADLWILGDSFLQTGCPSCHPIKGVKTLEDKHAQIYTTIKITSEFKNVSVMVGVVEVGMDDRR